MLSRRVTASLPWGAVVGAAVFCVLAVAVRGRRGLHIDRVVDNRLIHTGATVHHVAFWLRDIGNPFQFACLLAATLIVWKLCVGWGPAIAAGCGVGLDLVLIEYVLKPLIGRNPPHGHGNTFPSGHTGAAFGLATTLVVLLAHPSVARHIATVIRAALALGLFAIATGVALAMVVTRSHYFTDVIAGVPIGILVPLLSVALYDRLPRGRASSAGTTKHPVPGEPLDSTTVASVPH